MIYIQYVWICTCYVVCKNTVYSFTVGACDCSWTRSLQMARLPQTIHLLISPNSNRRRRVIVYVCVFERVFDGKDGEGENTVLSAPSMCVHLNGVWRSGCECNCRWVRQGQRIPALHFRWTEESLWSAGIPMQRQWVHGKWSRCRPLVITPLNLISQTDNDMELACVSIIHFEPHWTLYYILIKQVATVKPHVFQIAALVKSLTV